MNSDCGANELTDAARAGLHRAPPPRLLTKRWHRLSIGQSETRITRKCDSRAESEVLPDDSAIHWCNGHPTWNNCEGEKYVDLKNQLKYFLTKPQGKWVFIFAITLKRILSVNTLSEHTKISNVTVLTQACSGSGKVNKSS